MTAFVIQSRLTLLTQCLPDKNRYLKVRATWNGAKYFGKVLNNTRHGATMQCVNYCTHFAGVLRLLQNSLWARVQAWLTFCCDLLARLSLRFDHTDAHDGGSLSNTASLPVLTASTCHVWLIHAYAAYDSLGLRLVSSQQAQVAYDDACELCVRKRNFFAVVQPLVQP